jgi:predicted RND superfamily exporter protein
MVIPEVVGLDAGPLRVGFVSRLTDASLRAPARFLIVAGLLAAVAVWLASGLEIRSSFEELLPSNVPSVAHVKELVRRVGGDGTVLVVVQLLDPADGLEHAEELIRKLAGEYLAFGPTTIRAVEWNMEPVKRWYADHWPMFLSLDDLTEARDTLKKEVSKAKARANPLLLHLDDEPQQSPAPGPEALPWLDPKEPLPHEKVEQRFSRYKDGYLVPPDGRSLTMLVRPTGTALSVHEARQLLDRMRRVADAHQDELKQYHLRVGFAGTFPLFVAEYEAILNDIASTALITIVLVIASLLLFYRDVRSTVALAVAVLVAVAVTFGLTRLVIGYLNTQTAFLGAIVVGNGINYGLIYLARVNQLRRSGMALVPACRQGARTSARATLVAAAATSISFGVLVLAANRGFRHFGFIGGIGMLLCWLFTFALVPALLTVFERLHPFPSAAVKEPVPMEVPRFLRRVFAAPKGIVAVFGVLIVISLAAFLRQLPDALERNLENLTNDLRGRQEMLVEDNNLAQAALGRSVAGAIALLPSPEAADEFCEVIRQRATQPQWAGLIDGCDTISNVVPRFQKEKLAIIHEIERMLSDLVLEHLSANQAARLRVVKSQLAVQQPLRIQEAPPTLVDRFRERDGTIGRIAVITAKPNAKLELGPNLNNFAVAVRNVPVQGRLYDAAGENVVLADLLDNIAHEGPLTTFLSAVGVCILVVALFRSARASLLVISTLVTGVILMGGLAVAIGLKINFFNFIVFPITFGVAVDYGANVVARIRERGGNVLLSLVEVGPAVALCSWTSIIGYSSLLHATNRALKSFGWYAVIGELTSILSALLLLPALRLLIPAKVIIHSPEHSQEPS